ncbi:hypothetical protein RhiirA5_99589 [Rhizophagus irregularis]|uniref:C2H2-type domain-containing protein n=2 Tax=Rhizophagus irregularis TaxID=588596 RepID=A0A2I1FDQ7_9GLOM|nr:hypothetical protein GLOIN_2v1488874 [Rhizophagus irregularis DAOM 181602=DAOM 197198]PKB98577.1 hypothetical protein RhiirA5_99589 [Rhizophagus irregularis]PKC68913.1 hypothetical protein RhiirA1_392510 [Rhizophagus irregularis]PKY32467.1 hypothetical protein RhiirB3_112134 [Rhizophagus irregularis]POG58087.1 hypothetical protein GLOIN_2v1488874 [Rhizophagus irregularis DAOM 181602=DAOM 197198]CAB4491679.1 unnamed protein product [Rhizophagus irregularis]|eukprot:XP_025164953.1 hypothetical protein GLOIN_2v1488874 [Rhizophagus irregularis DAOM 181602=DAOM 197198]
MSESVASITPFVCKWFGCHSKRFSTQVDLEYHVYTDHQDLNKLKTLYRGLPIYNCPWEGCKYRLRDISKFREHLLKHTQQRPFKCPLCPICNDSRQFETLEELNQHLILNHNDSVVDHSGAVDNTNHEKLEKGTIAKSTEYEEDYLICKALAKNYDRESYEKLLVQYGLTDVIDLDDFF